MIAEMMPLDEDDREDKSDQDVLMDSPTYPVSDSAADLRTIETAVLELYIVFGLFASRLYNGIEPARMRWFKTQVWKLDPDIPRRLEYAKERCLSLLECDE